MWIVWLAVGYVLAVLFPVPGISRAILDGWTRLLVTVKDGREARKTPTSLPPS